MKQLLLLAGLLAAASPCGAQAPAWGLRNTAGPIETPSGHYAMQTVAVDATTAWHLMAVNGADLGLETATHLARTTDGVHWTYRPITGTPGFASLHLAAVDAHTAYVAQVGTGRGGGPSGGGEILRTRDGGQTWQKVTVTEFTGPGSFLHWVHFFDAATGLAFGRPDNGDFEVYRTTDGAATWQRVPAANLPAPQGGEHGPWSYFALGHTVWAGMGSGAGPSAAPVRILKSTDQGRTWNESPPTDLIGYVASLAFKDPDNGLAYSIYGNDGRGSLVRTTDGGATWAPIAPMATPQGRFYGGKLDAIPGAFLSAGATGGLPFTPGSSVSADGLVWRDIASPLEFLSSLDALSPTVAFAGSFTGRGAVPTAGAGGVYQLSGDLRGGVATATGAGKAPPATAVYPNPSATGVFHLRGPAAREARAHVRVWDLLGREVLSAPLRGPGPPGPEPATVDLRHAPAGWYTLDVRWGASVERVRVCRQ